MKKLEDLLVMEVPTITLQYVSSCYKLKPGGNSRENYAKVIISNPDTLSIAKELADFYQYAGRTAVSLHQPKGISEEKLSSKSAFKDFLSRKYGKSIFEEDGIKPQLSEKPKLFYAYEFGEKLILAFTFLGSERRVLRNFQITKEKQQHVDYLVLHFNPFVVEIRASSKNVPLFKNAILDVIGIENKEIIEWINYSKLSDSEVVLLKKQLNCKLKGSKHKMTEGIYSTKEVTANPEIDDLSTQQEYQKEFSGKPYRSITYKFNFKHFYGLEQEISMKITQDGIYFTCAVSEEIIEYVISNILSIKVASLKEVAEEVAAAKESMDSESIAKNKNIAK